MRLGAGLRVAKELQGLGEFPLSLYRNHTHKTPHFLTKKNNIYIIYIYIYLTNVKEKHRLCKSPLCLLVLLRSLPPQTRGRCGRGLYLDVSMFSSLKLLQCSITLRAISLVSCRAVAILIMSLRRGIPPSLISRGQYLSG